MEVGVVQIVAVIGSVCSVLCTLVVGALAFFLKRTLSSLEEADRKNAAEIEKVKNDLCCFANKLRKIFIQSAKKKRRLKGF